jgi:hypothetical protein
MWLVHNGEVTPQNSILLVSKSDSLLVLFYIYLQKLRSSTRRVWWEEENCSWASTFLSLNSNFRHVRATDTAYERRYSVLRNVGTQNSDDGGIIQDKEYNNTAHGPKTEYVTISRLTKNKDVQLMYICNYLVFRSITEALRPALWWQLKLSVSDVNFSRC